MRKALLVFLAAMILGWSFSNSYAAIIILPSTANGTSLSVDPDPAKVKAAIDELKGLSGKEKRTQIIEAKTELKAFNAAKKAGKEPDTNTLLLAILAILLPPLAVYLHEGETNTKFWITLLLFVLGLAGVFFLSFFLILVPIVYALIVILGDK